MKTVCRPSDRDINWRSKSHHVQVKEPYGNSNWLLAGLHPATRGGGGEGGGGGGTMYTVCVHLGSLDVVEERKKERRVFYAIAHKNMLFLIFRNMIWIVLKYCLC